MPKKYAFTSTTMRKNQNLGVELIFEMHLKAWCVRLIWWLGSQIPLEWGGTTVVVRPTHTRFNF